MAFLLGRHGEKHEGKCCRIHGFLNGIAIAILKGCFFLIALFLAYEGARISYFSSPDYYSQSIFEISDYAGRHLLIFGGVCFIAGIILFAGGCLSRKFLKDKELICRIVLLLACVWVAVVGFLYIREHPYYPAGDQINTTAGAAYARSGNYIMFQKGGYIGLYEQQKGLLFLYEILFSIFGDFCYDVAAKIHVLFSVITVIAGYGFLKIVAGKPFIRILYCALMMFCVPYFIYLPYIYGDLPSICFSMILFWALAAYAKKFQKRYLIAGCIAAMLALLVRMNIWIVLIAVMIGMILLAMEKGTIRPILAGLCIILSSCGAVKGVDLMYECRSGLESGIGIPRILWVAMGLQETRGNPGVYNRYQQSVFEECGFEREPAIQIGKEYISGRLEEFRENPGYAVDFFTKKIKMQWLEPLFEGLYATETFGNDREVPEWIESLYYGKLHDIVWKIGNYYQSIIYLAVFVFAVGSILGRRKCFASNMGWVPLIAVVGGFLFSIIWENQCRYVLPYYMYMIVYASLGIGKTAEIIILPFRRKIRQENKDEAN